MASRPDETRHGVDLTHLDQELFAGAGVTKRQLVDYLDAVADRLVPELKDRPLSVIRTTPEPFMQKNVPKYTPDWIRTVPIWAEASKRTVSYALCNDRRTLLWFANQRAVEYHPTLAPDRTAGPRRPPRARPRSAARGRLRRRRRRRPPRPRRPRRGRSGRRREDQRRQGRPRLRADHRPRLPGGRRRGHEGHRPPGRGAGPGDRHHRVRQGGPRGQGVRRRHPRRRRHGRRRLQPARPTRRAGLVPGVVGVAGRRRRRRTSRSPPPSSASATATRGPTPARRPSACRPT